MKTKPLFIMIGVAVVLSGLLVVQHFLSYMTHEELKVERRIQPNWVRGSALVKNEIPYTLNFDQQLELINIVNNSEPFSSVAPQVKLGITKIAIYRFSPEQEVGIVAVGSVSNRVVYQVKGFNDEALLIEREAGSLKKLIDSSTNEFL